MSRRDQTPTRSVWQRAALLALAGTIATLTAALLLSACGNENTCYLGGYFSRCEGNTVVSCGGGWGGTYKVQREDCGPSKVCATDTWKTGYVDATCRPPCDPATYVTQCDGGIAFNCEPLPDGGGIPRSMDCATETSCLMRNDGGRPEAWCNPPPADGGP